VLTGTKRMKLITNTVVTRCDLVRIRDLWQKLTDIVYIGKKERLNRS
jgi:hypothetical protein